MVNDDVVFGFRLRLFSLARELGNVGEACRIFGVHSRHGAGQRRLRSHWDGDDLSAERKYLEVAQLLNKGRRVGEPGLEHVVPFVGLPNGVIEFNSSTTSFPRSVEKGGLIDLIRGHSPLQPEPLLVRVTPTPPPPIRDSELVQLNPATPTS